ncbi:MAG: hypothetical protein A3E80_02770 [Chlamydiae bacterium RIFCSPHIGHO2_12_FULL_49_9]|nr:MAG: hypothetical protein A3E80_02770 [Chlamydiae bacterium RIFCSPHIGHO2_12_FULL_49_9]
MRHFRGQVVIDKEDLVVKVAPNASKNEIIGWREGILCVRIKGIPEKGRVNEELIEFLADALDISKSRIEIVSGHTSRIKRLKIQEKNWRDRIK